MGYYTGLRMKVTIKEEYREEFQRIHENFYFWDGSNIKEMQDFYSKYKRDTFMVNSTECMPSSWDDGEDVFMVMPVDEFKTGFDKETGRFTFSTSLKSRDGEVEYFITQVMSEVVEDVEYIEQYEELERMGYLYELDKGEIRRNGGTLSYK